MSAGMRDGGNTPPEAGVVRPVQEGVRAKYAYNHVKRLILDGDKRAGDRLDVNLLREDLGVSRQPVIQALNRLATEGFVRVLPQVGCWVAESDAGEIGNFFRLFAATEAVAAELAAENGTASELAQLRAIDRKIEALLSGRATDVGHRYRMLNREFHGQTHVMARSSYVRDAASGMWDRCDFYLNTHGRNLLADRAKTSHGEHAAIIEAIAARDGARARAVTEQHVLQFGQAAIALMQQASASAEVNGGGTVKRRVRRSGRG